MVIMNMLNSTTARCLAKLWRFTPRIAATLAKELFILSAARTKHQGGETVERTTRTTDVIKWANEKRGKEGNKIRREEGGEGKAGLGLPEEIEQDSPLGGESTW